MRRKDSTPTRPARKPGRPSAPYGGAAPVAPGSDTSALASQAMSDHARISKKSRIEHYIRGRGAAYRTSRIYRDAAGTVHPLYEGGATREEIMRALGIAWPSVGGRVAELYQEGTIGSNPGEVRLGSAGLPVEVLVAAEHVRRWNEPAQGAEGAQQRLDL